MLFLSKKMTIIFLVLHRIKRTISERKCHWGALNVHGLTRKILSQFRGIAEVVKEFMEYIADSPLLGQNA